VLTLVVEREGLRKETNDSALSKKWGRNVHPQERERCVKSQGESSAREEIYEEVALTWCGRSGRSRTGVALVGVAESGLKSDCAAGGSSGKPGWRQKKEKGTNSGPIERRLEKGGERLYRKPAWFPHSGRGWNQTTTLGPPERGDGPSPKITGGGAVAPN